MAKQSLTFLCVACYLKGGDFLKGCKEAGNRVYLLTTKELANAQWPHEAIDEKFYLENAENSAQNFEAMVKGLAFLMRTQNIDRIVALDDFDVEKAAYLREVFRVPGMGQTTARYFRDKLAMRMKAAEANILVPPFSALFKDDDVNYFVDHIPGPWVIKPRGEASAAGIKKVHNREEAWRVINDLGEERYNFLIEQFLPGDVYHADAMTVESNPVFCRVSKYLNPPIDVAHGGGVFMTQTVPYGGEEDYAIQKLNQRVLKAFGLQYSASHTEFIQAKEDGRYYFLETSSRVGGAHIAEMVHFSSGLNIWKEWAILEDCVARGLHYQLPVVNDHAAGLIVSLSRYENPDTSSFVEPEIVWRLTKPYHVGFIIKSGNPDQVRLMLNHFADRIQRSYHASMPPKDKISE